VPPSAARQPRRAMTTELRRRRGILREATGEAWGLLVEVIVVGLAALAALAVAALVLLVA
jgi:hypothetical protein